MYGHPLATRKTPPGKRDDRAGRPHIRRQLSRRLQLERLKPERHLGLADRASDRHRHSARDCPNRQPELAGGVERAAGVGLEFGHLGATLADGRSQRLVAGPATADEGDRRARPAGIIAELQARTERQDDELGHNLDAALLTHEQQLLVPVRQVGQVEGTAHGKLPLRVGGQPQ